MSAPGLRITSPSQSWQYDFCFYVDIHDEKKFIKLCDY